MSREFAGFSSLAGLGPISDHQDRNCHGIHSAIATALPLLRLRERGREQEADVEIEVEDSP